MNPFHSTMPKESKIHAHCSSDKYCSLTPCPNVYIYIGTPTLFSFPCNLIHPSLHRWIHGLSKNRPSFRSLQPIRFPHSREDVADMPYGDETWMTELVGSASERGEGSCMRFEVVLHGLILPRRVASRRRRAAVESTGTLNRRISSYESQ